MTSPAALTVAIAALLVLQAPLPPLRTTPFAVYVAVPPMHKGEDPLTDVMAAFGLIVTARRADTVPPQPPVIV